MKQTNQENNGLRWHAANVDDLDFADDLAILADCITNLQNKSTVYEINHILGFSASGVCI